MAFTLWHPDAVSGSHPPHLLLGVKQKLDFGGVRSAFDPTETSLGEAAELDTLPSYSVALLAGPKERV
jgi:hypothetical protein